jgi:predicted nucleotidyltransferase
MAIFSQHGGEMDDKSLHKESTEQSPDAWKWRLNIAREMARKLDPKKYGVLGLYVFGSTVNGSAGAGSDIDLLVHVDENNWNKDALANWLEGWSLALSELNYQKTGYKSDGLLDIHYVTDTDIEKKDSYAIKINAVSDGATLLEFGEKFK